MGTNVLYTDLNIKLDRPESLILGGYRHGGVVAHYQRDDYDYQPIIDSPVRVVHTLTKIGAAVPQLCEDLSSFRTRSEKSFAW